jgi:hypothetical protein
MEVPMGLRSRPLPLLTLALLFAAAATPASAATSNGIRAEIVVCGSTASEHRHRSTTYVEAIDGCEYAIRLVNESSDRLAVHVSVDGLNTIDASTDSAARGPRWVLEPWQSATIPGWQTGSSTTRRFYFTTTDQSYADWIGDRSDVGEIRVVAYRERRPEPVPITIDPGWDGWRRSSGESRSDDGTSAWDGDTSSRKRAQEESSTFGAAPSADASSRSSERVRRDDRAATGIGRESGHRVGYTSFDAESWASARITLRYGYREQLLAWGVLPRHDCWCCDDGFAPDPYVAWDRRCR